jgi:hypothetical protein
MKMTLQSGNLKIINEKMENSASSEIYAGEDIRGLLNMLGVKQSYELVNMIAKDVANYAVYVTGLITTIATKKTIKEVTDQYEEQRKKAFSEFENWEQDDFTRSFVFTFGNSLESEKVGGFGFLGDSDKIQIQFFGPIKDAFYSFFTRDSESFFGKAGEAAWNYVKGVGALKAAAGLTSFLYDSAVDYKNVFQYFKNIITGDPNSPVIPLLNKPVLGNFDQLQLDVVKNINNYIVKAVTAI